MQTLNMWALYNVQKNATYSWKSEIGNYSKNNFGIGLNIAQINFCTNSFGICFLKYLSEYAGIFIIYTYCI